MTTNPDSQRASDERAHPESGPPPLARDLLLPLRRAVDLYLAGDFALAEDRLRALVKAAPDQAQAHHHLGVVLRARGQFAGAIAHLERALELDPHLVGAADRIERYRAEQAQSRAGRAA
ncbi:MAG: tetratricopeptide repeat protein [Planctomycetota bacterium]